MEIMKDVVEVDANTEQSDKYSALFSSEYATKIFYDVGCTPTSYFKDKPDNYKNVRGSVSTASNEKIQSFEQGDIKIQNLKLNNVIHVPEFKYNLLSGIQIMKEGFKQIIDNDKLEILNKKGNV